MPVDGQSTKRAVLSGRMRYLLHVMSARADRLVWQREECPSAYFPVAPWIVGVPLRSVKALYARGLIEPCPTTSRLADRWEMVLTATGHEAALDEP